MFFVDLKPPVRLAFVAIKIYNMDLPRDMAEPVNNFVKVMATGATLTKY